MQHGFYTRWLPILLCAHMEQFRLLDLLKAFGYIERVIKSDFFFEKRPCLHHTCAMLNEQPSSIKTMLYVGARLQPDRNQPVHDRHESL